VWAAVLVHAAWNATDALVPPVGDAGIALRAVATLTLAVAVAAYWRARRRSSGAGSGPGADGPVLGTGRA
jgi:membrane protein DedA with SNARE-associated domain